MISHPSNPEAYVAKPIPYVLRVRSVDGLTLGYEGRNISFSWRPYEKRTPAARADYDRLYKSIVSDGLQQPIITYGDCVLIGMRRVEIARKLDIRLLHAADVTEDVYEWWQYDIERLERLKAAIGETRY